MVIKMILSFDLLIQFLFFPLIFSLEAKNYLKSFSPDEINEFIDSAVQLNLTSLCRSSLHKIHSYLSAYDTLKEQREFFYESYGTSESAKLLISRDRHHWRYRYLQCINVAGETKTTVSEYPFMYCYAYDNLKSNSPVIGLCLPTPCSPDKFELARHWARSMGSTNITTFKKVQCGESRDNTQWYERPFVVANYFINKVLILILACSTIYHIKRGIKSKSFARNLFLAFSTLRNFRTITQKPKKQEITCIYGLRVIGTAWVILGHSSMIIQGFLKNLEEYRDTVVNNFLYQVVTNCFLSVDLFFLLSGTLIMHSWLQSKQKKDETSSFSYWLCFYWNRIVRLWPTLLFSIIYIPIDTAVFLHRPPWRFEDPAKNCAKDWWKNLLFINSIIESNCLPWTWYIGTDFILYLISPIYLLTFKKSRELGLTISVATVVVCAILNIITARKYNFPPTQFVWNVPPIFNPDYMEHYYTDYTKPQSRIGSYIVGLLLGYHLATSDGKLSQRKVLYGWLLSAILGFISLFGLYPSLQGWHWWSYHLFYTAFHRTAWAIAVAWLIFSCHSGYANYLNRFLSSPFFVFVSKTCYTAYMCHLLPIGGLFEKTQFPIVFHGVQTILGFVIKQIVFSHILGFFTTFLIEHPFININKLIWTSVKMRSKKADRTKNKTENLNQNDKLGYKNLKKE